MGGTGVPPNGYVLTNGFGNGTTPYGNQWEFLFFGATDSQTVSSGFALGATYDLSVSAADDYSDPNAELTLSVSGGATASQTFAVPPGDSTTGPLPFATYTLAFTPTSNAAVTITLEVPVTSQGDLALDNVQLVPEPSTRALLLAGAGLLGLMLKRRDAVRA